MSGKVLLFLGLIFWYCGKGIRSGMTYSTLGGDFQSLKRPILPQVVKGARVTSDNRNVGTSMLAVLVITVSKKV